ncbi:MAG: quinone oxidoreductase, partial [Steroidobacteraceae bacterium]
MPSTRAIRVHEFGGPEQMRLEQLELPEPAPGEARIRHTAIGLNFIDIYERTGLYPLQLPAGLGREAAGVIEQLGRGVRGFDVGDRVAYTTPQAGAYAEHRNISASSLVPVPDDVSDEVAAAVLLKGLTAQALVRGVFPLKRTHRALIHAAAGGVGLLLVQWALHLGAKVIAIVGSEQKANLVRAQGAEHVLLSQSNWPEDVKRMTNGGVDVAYDSVGKDTFAGSLASLRPRGMMVTYGNASGPVPPVAPLELARQGSLFLTRPVLFDYIRTRAELTRAAAELFGLISTSVLKVHIGARYAVSGVVRAHEDLAAR